MKMAGRAEALARPTMSMFPVSVTSPTGTRLRSLLRASTRTALDSARRSATGRVLRDDLRKAGDAFSAGLLVDACRQVDRAWRFFPGHAPTLAPLYGRLLSHDPSQHDAALRLLSRALEIAPDPDTAALTALAALRGHLVGLAKERLDDALGQFCVLPNSLLAYVAGLALRDPAIGAPGWIGRGARLECVGEILASAPSNVLEFRLDGRPCFRHPVRQPLREGRRRFRLPMPQIHAGTSVEVTLGGAPLLGSGRGIPPDFSLDGRAESDGRLIRGWARVGWAPARPVRLRVEDEAGRSRLTKTRGVAKPGGRWAFVVDIRRARLRGHRLLISAQLPNGRWQPLPDTPLLLDGAIRRKLERSTRLPEWGGSRRRRRARAASTGAQMTDIIIPVYRGREETLSCIHSVLTTAGRAGSVVVVDDATDDAALAAALDELSRPGRITLLRNTENRGFAASVNRALDLNPTHDAVILNSDTRVFGNWLDRLRRAAYGARDVGTVTPLSNSGSIASYPRAEGSAIEPEAAAVLDAIATGANHGTSIEIPVGVGFCMYLRRDCLRDVGTLDTELFGKGYGEETDFCLRARQRGWSHRLAADVFVYHAGGVSFGGRRAALLDRSHRLINLRHPGYDRFIATFLAKDPLRGARRALDERRLSAFEGRFVLVVTLALAGGVDRFVFERCQSIRRQGLFPLVLRPAEAGDSRRCELWTDALAVPNLRYQIPGELSRLTALLRSLRVESIELQHFLHLDARVIEAVRELPIPYVVFVHDYAWYCPRVNLIDGSGRYCGEPAISVCRTCVRQNGSNLDEAISVSALRTRSNAWLRAARRVTAPSADAASRLQRQFPGLPVAVQPHAQPVVPMLLPSGARPRNRIRVALIGSINRQKGYWPLLACARDARARKLPLEFVMIGSSEEDAPLLATGKVFITGRYAESEASHLLVREQPDVAWFPSVAPDTWCYTLDYALAMGLPVIAFDLGAIAERVRAAGVGELLPLALKPARINDRLLRLAQTRRALGASEAHFV
jgi:GT2 family glycosyltransferase